MTPAIDEEDIGQDCDEPIVEIVKTSQLKDNELCMSQWKKRK